jgi:quaternary ammonium compound-resistance protein SugE
MAWLYLILAGILEIGWAIGLRYTDGFSRLWPSIGTILAMVASFICLSQAVKTLPIGLAYTIWTGIGAVGTVILSHWLLGETINGLGVVFIALIIAGIIGLKLVSAH